MNIDNKKTLRVGLLRRLAAAAYDWLLLVALWMLVATLFLLVHGGNAPEPGTALNNALRACLLAVTALFFTGFWKFGGQTLGMRAWRLQVIRDDEAPLTWADSSRRLLAAILSLLPAGAGFWWILVDKEGRAWHDRLSHTQLRRVA